MNIYRANGFCVVLLVVACVAGCKNPSGPADTAMPQDEKQRVAGPRADAAPGPEAAEDGFSITSVPVSDAPLGEFPYFTLPAGYANLRDPELLEFGVAPVWTGKTMELVEGRTYQAVFGADGDKAFSALEVERNLDHLVKAVGGVKVASGTMPLDLSKEIPDDVRFAFNTGLGDMANAPSHVWLVRRHDRNIWIHTSSGPYGGGWFVVETAPFVATASLLPASQLQSALDADGRVAIEVNFATNESEILPESLPQLDEVVALLEGAPTLRLGVDGHTDNSGDAARNQTLSDARARAVAAALVSRGVDASRLAAKGHGATRPVDDNATEAGKARNRRVELVKL